MKNLVVNDCEVYPNYFLAAFKNIDNDKTVTIEARGEDQPLSEENRRKLNTVLHKYITFGFNSNNYDIPIMLYALRGKTCREIFEMSEFIIAGRIDENGKKAYYYGWQILQHYGLVIPEGIKHFDIQEPSPGVKVSLKLYGGRMHSQRLQDLPIEPGTILTKQQMNEIGRYCINDLDTTIDLFRKIEDRIDLRVDMSEEYGLNLLSKSDAQIAEAVIKCELKKRNKSLRLKAPKIAKDATYKYKKPKFINFITPELQAVLKLIEESDFALDAKGSIQLPKELKAAKITIGYSTYQLGIGGLHSNEKKQTIEPNEYQILCDKDVAAYYPSIILNNKLYPPQLGEIFLDIYREIVEKRLAAKASGNKVVNESLKIVINGSFGKLGSKYSCLYSPDLMMMVTLTGQLSLLMLIELLEEFGISVISANTDGFVSLIPKNKYDLYTKICEEWEKKTQFILEETQYKALYSRDINNYLAITDYGSKGKGIFTLDAISKNPTAPISVIAVQELLVNNTSIYDTIRQCKDLTQFLTVRTVAGGATWKGEYLGRVVRWIWAIDGEKILYKKVNKTGNHNKVAKSDGARPIMELTDEWPEDLDYQAYINESLSILDDIGLTDF